MKPTPQRVLWTELERRYPDDIEELRRIYHEAEQDYTRDLKYRNAKLSIARIKLRPISEEQKQAHIREKQRIIDDYERQMR